VQATAAGAAEQVRAAGLSAEELDRVVVTTAGGVHAVPLAEFCLMGLLALTKNLPRVLADQRARHWNHYVVAELRGRTLLVVGLGAIGTEVARLATMVGMRVLAVTREPRDSPVCERVEPPDRLGEVLPEAEAVVVTVPLTRATEGLIGREVFDVLKPGAILVNVGRGGVVDEGALVEALRNSRLGGAALDVFATEPLPPDSPLWDLPNVIVSPHTAALSAKENERIVALFRENLRRYVDGAELLNRVDPAVL
jgi:phosphoglycerate dehydrogenase-like enzyme